MSNFGIGKRKNAIAKATLKEGNGKIIVNGKECQTYFENNPFYMFNVNLPHSLVDIGQRHDIIISTFGGGISAQSQAVMYAIAKLILKISPESRKILKENKLLTRDSRKKERKKYGLKSARRAPQFSKR